MQDYQGDGYGDYCGGHPEPTANTLYFVFKPKKNTIDAFTYSPLLSQFETDDSSQFSLTHKMAE